MDLSSSRSEEEDLYSLEASQTRLHGRDDGVHHPLLPLPVAGLDRFFVAANESISITVSHRHRLNPLDIHWDATFTNDDGHFAELLPAGIDNVLELNRIILLGPFTAEVQGFQDKHALLGQLATRLVSWVV